MPKDKAEKKSKKEKRPIEIDVDGEGDVSMAAQETVAVEVIKASLRGAEKKAKKGKDEKEAIIVPIEELSPIAHPLANKKLVKKLHKTVKKASKGRQVKRGVKEVVKSIRKGEKGLLILAADISPIDIISHLPVMAEDASIPYVFVASKEELGQASSTKRPTSCVLVCPDAKKKKKKVEGQEGMVEGKEDDYRELYDEVHAEVKALDEQNHHRLRKKVDSKHLRQADPLIQAPALPFIVAVVTPMPSAAAPKKDQKKAAPAVKSSSAKTPAAAPTTGFAAADDVPRVAGGRPDQAAFNAQQDALKNEIDALKSQLDTIKEKIGSTGKNGPHSERKAALRAEQDILRSQQSGNKTSRNSIFEELKTLQDGVQKKIKDLQAAKTKVSYKTVEEVDDRIRKLDSQIEGGNMKIADEKRAINEISQLRRSRKTVEAFQSDEDSIQADKARIDELKKQLDDPEAKAVSERYDAIKLELDEIKEAEDEAWASRNKLYDERTELSANLDAVWAKKREAQASFREANDRYFAKVAEDRARRAERARLQREQEETERRKERARQLREEAEIPAFQVEVEDCQTLIDLFTGKISGAAADTKVSTSKSTVVSGVPELSIRQVEADPAMVALKKKGKEEENYFVAKKKKGPAPKSNPAPTAPAPKPEAQFQVSFSTLTALGTLSIPPPSSNADVERCIADLQKKKDWYTANQKRVTAEKIAKADEEIRRLEALAGNGTNWDGASAEVPNGNGENLPEPEPTLTVAEDVSTDVPPEQVDEKLEEAKEAEVSA
ncbi:hypothetical protein FRC10_000684 [Ceratobasidium sp. 414]|nr:hypothetical protein FRC10_000684 [Ceratobasidium sp. 414]